MSSAEVDENVRLQQARTERTDSLIRAWDGEPGSHWTRTAVERLDFYWPLLPDVRLATPTRAARVMALLHVGLHDAMIATWDAKYAYPRQAPSRAHRGGLSLVPAVASPSYTSEHAAAAGAAAMIRSYRFPRDDTAPNTRPA
ncbi:MAG: hypothetical protein ACT4P7_09545, partial [Gemmatimonadaceae bacterium]